MKKEHGDRVAVVIDTGHEQASIRLYKGEDLVGQKQWKNDRTVGQRCLEAMDALLLSHSVDWAVVERMGVFVGPARYQSSLRAGVVIAQMIGLARQIPIIELSKADYDALPTSVWTLEPSVLPQARYDGEKDGA